MERRGAIVRGDRMLHPAEPGKILLEQRDVAPIGGDPSRIKALCNVALLVFSDNWSGHVNLSGSLILHIHTSSQYWLRGAATAPGLSLEASVPRRPRSTHRGHAGHPLC